MFDSIENIYKEYRKTRTIDLFFFVGGIVLFAVIFCVHLLKNNILIDLTFTFIGLILILGLYSGYILIIAMTNCKNKNTTFKEKIRKVYEDEYINREKAILSILKENGVRTKEDILLLINYYEKKSFNIKKKEYFNYYLTIFFGVLTILSGLGFNYDDLLNWAGFLVIILFIINFFRLFLNFFKGLISMEEESLYRDIHQSLHVILFNFDELFNK